MAGAAASSSPRPPRCSASRPRSTRTRTAWRGRRSSRARRRGSTTSRRRGRRGSRPSWRRGRRSSASCRARGSDCERWLSRIYVDVLNLGIPVKHPVKSISGRPPRGRVGGYLRFWRLRSLSLSHAPLSPQGPGPGARIETCPEIFKYISSSLCGARRRPPSRLATGT